MFVADLVAGCLVLEVVAIVVVVLTVGAVPGQSTVAFVDSNVVVPSVVVFVVVVATVAVVVVVVVVVVVAVVANLTGGVFGSLSSVAAPIVAVAWSLAFH